MLLQRSERNIWLIGWREGSHSPFWFVGSFHPTNSPDISFRSLHSHVLGLLPELDPWWGFFFINDQSKTVTHVSVIYHHGNILITLWRNRNVCKIHFTIEHQFCYKLYRDHHWSPSSGKYFHNITWFFDKSPLKRSWQWSKHIGHAYDWFVIVILYL